MTEEAIRQQSQEAWRLIHFQGMTQRQVAAHLGVDQSTDKIGEIQ